MNDADHEAIKHPVVRAEAIQASLQPKQHPLNKDAVRIQACLSDMAGITGTGVHFVRLDPNTPSTTMHYHLHESEWLYILSGSGTLQLLDARPRDLLPSSNQQDAAAEELEGRVEEFPLGPGDFVGLQSGLNSSRWAHNMCSGPEGMTYLMGGERKEMDVCVYPLLGKMLIDGDKEGKVWTTGPSVASRP